MIVTRLELVDFRNYASALFELEEGVTAVLGRNGQGKTNFAEALAYLATLASFTATCEQLNLNPWLWLRDTLNRLPVTPSNQIATLLPTAAK